MPTGPVPKRAMMAQALRGFGPAHAVFTLGALLLGAHAAPAVGPYDAGELGVAAVTLGVPHPTGFAVDMLLLRAAAYVPFGHIAMRQNLLVALLGAACLAALTRLCCGWLRAAGCTPAQSMLALPVALLSLATWPTFVAVTTVVEVYASALLLLLCGGIWLQGQASARRRHHGLLLPALGLCTGLHVTAGPLMAVMTAVAVWQRPRQRRLRFVGLCAPALCATAAVVLYLPLASRRQPPLDWGNPETLTALLHHLTATRIREAFAGAAQTGGGGFGADLLSQLAELGWPCLCLAGLGLVLGLRRLRGATLWLAAVFTADLAYARWVNPMGIADRQVGHVAGACLTGFSVLGFAFGAAALRTRLPQRIRFDAGLFLVALALSAAAMASGYPRLKRATIGYVADELYGGGGALLPVPPRSALVTWSDSQTAVALFARHAELTRPDVSVAPAQHLWDLQYQRRLRPLPMAAGAVDDRDPGKAAVAERVVLGWVAPVALPRPVLFESPAPLARLGAAAGLAPWPVPWFRNLSGQDTRGADAKGWQRALDRFSAPRVAPVSARQGRGAPQLSAWTWARTYRLAAEQALRAGDPHAAVSLARRAVALCPATPGRAGSHIALSVALARLGRWAPALVAARQAVALAPGNLTAWTNLIRFSSLSGDAAAAADALRRARAFGLRDGRLDRLERPNEPFPQPPP